ncbi:hypothetical protein P3X46_028213 [Hevea brasiliensis]|uniref:Uncharacterized protein n=1 Tax=Hevea brasiliensis TaxID=3981 RepID=A0ABQ9KNC6_HEVBR|nr:hypothetical protein P3X46_028213 [Hevea brasiliensis]
MGIFLIPLCSLQNLCFLLNPVFFVVLVLYVMFVRRLLNWIQSLSNVSSLGTPGFKKGTAVSLLLLIVILFLQMSHFLSPLHFFLNHLCMRVRGRRMIS